MGTRAQGRGESPKRDGFTLDFGISNAWRKQCRQIGLPPWCRLEDILQSAVKRVLISVAGSKVFRHGDFQTCPPLVPLRRTHRRVSASGSNSDSQVQRDGNHITPPDRLNRAGSLPARLQVGRCRVAW